MTVSTIEQRARRKATGRKEKEREHLHRGAGEALDHETIAELPLGQISRMNTGELVRVVRASPLRILRPEVETRLEYQDRETLERLAHLARLCCRHRDRWIAAEHS
jgi:hypothetical protein